MHAIDQARMLDLRFIGNKKAMATNLQPSLPSQCGCRLYELTIIYGNVNKQLTPLFLGLVRY